MNIASFLKESEECFYLEHFPHQAVLSRPLSHVLVTLMQKGINFWSSSFKVAIMPRLSGYTNSLMCDKPPIFRFVQWKRMWKSTICSLLAGWLGLNYKVQRWMSYLPLKNEQCYFPSQKCDVPVMMLHLLSLHKELFPHHERKMLICTCWIFQFLCVKIQP